MPIAILIYLAIIVAGLLLGGAWLLTADMSPSLAAMSLALKCSVTAGLGGCLYCLRAIYLNVSVRKQFNSEWIIWYFIRPIVSIGCGAVSYLFLRAGLLVLDAGVNQNSSDIGFLALAFVAGLNVDRFIAKVEDVAQSVWGIEKSRTAKQKDNLDVPGDI